MRGRFIESYLIYPNPKLDDGEWVGKDLNFLFIGMVGQKQRELGVRTQGRKLFKGSTSSSDLREESIV